jgi:hypothetical protein
VVALAHLAFGGQPVFVFVAGLESATLGEQVGEAASLFTIEGFLDVLVGSGLEAVVVSAVANVVETG